MDGLRGRMQGVRQTAFARATLPIANALIASDDIIVQGYTNVVLYGDYENDAADAELDLLVEWSPWTAAEVPAGDQAWYPHTLLSTPEAVGGAMAVSILEANLIRFLAVGATVSPFTLHLTVPNFVERLRVRLRDNSIAKPGDAALYAVVGDETDAAWGLTLQGAHPAAAAAPIDANIQVGNVDVSDVNPVPTLPVLPATPYYNQLTAALADTAYPLAAVATPLVGGQVAIKALSGNTDVVVIGGVAVTLANGYPLDASEEVPVLIDDLSTLYYRATIINEGIAFITS